MPGDAAEAEKDARAERWLLLSGQRERVLRSLRRRFGEFADAEDVVDEAMLRLVDLPDLGRQQVSALLYITAHNLNIDRHRRGIRHQRAASRLPSPGGESPADVAIARDELRRALSCVARLSRKERQALAGRVLGYRPAETAELLGVPTASVYQALSRARSALRAMLGGAALVLGLLRKLGTASRAAAVPVSAAAASVAVGLAVAHPGSAPSPGPAISPFVPAAHATAASAGPQSVGGSGAANTAGGHPAAADSEGSNGTVAASVPATGTLRQGGTPIVTPGPVPGAVQLPSLQSLVQQLPALTVSPPPLHGTLTPTG